MEENDIDPEWIYSEFDSMNEEINKLKQLIDKSRDSVEDELNTLLNGLVYQRNAKERIEYLNQLLNDINKVLKQ